MRFPRRRGDSSAVVRGWVAFYTLGLPATMRARRRSEIVGDLADEQLDAIRRGRVGDLRSQRIRRLVTGIPDDIIWRVLDAPGMARLHQVNRAWTPPTRWAMALLAIVAIGTGGALGIGTVPVLLGADPGSWAGWSRTGFSLAGIGIMVGVGAAVAWPRRGMTIVALSALVGFVATPWLWGGWLLAVVAVGVRAVGPREAGLRDECGLRDPLESVR